MSIDLHIHSLFSDGTCTPCELVAIATKRGLSAISITDHDTLSGTEEALAAAGKLAIEVVSGIELSARHGDCELHILGYFISHDNTVFRDRILKLQSARRERNDKIIEKLNTLGMSLNLEEVMRVSRYGQTGRPHIAKVLFNKGYVKTIGDAFEYYLRRGAQAYEPRFVYGVEETIRFIREAGGLAVLAHPLQIDPTLAGMQRIINDLADMGLDGLEIFYPTHTAKIRRRLRKISAAHDFIYTGGSDYHGDIRPGTTLAGGRNFEVPAGLLDKMKQRLNI